jgi:hypothetical protein
VTVRVLSEFLVEEYWHVNGPQKAYDSMTTLHRIDVSSLA